MGFRVSVPAIQDRPACAAVVNVEEEDDAITLTERLIGYVVVGLPYAITECDDVVLDSMGVAKGTAKLIV